MAIRVHYQNVKFQISGSAQIKKWLISAAINEGYSVADLDYFFIDDDSQRNINSEFLEHDYNTDVITFDYSSGKKIRGEIYIAIETVKRNSVNYKTKFRQEYLRVMIHGLLHLAGYNDKSEDDSKLMRVKEDYYLRRIDNGKY